MEKQLPKNWIEVQLIDILEVLENGSRPKGGVQGIFDGVPSLGGEHLNSNGGFKFGKLKYVPTSFAEKMNRGKIKENDILIVKDGATTGKTSFIDNNFPFDLAFVNEHVFICRTFPNLNSKCVFYFLFGKSGFNRIMENFTGSAQGGINQKFARNTLIPLPPLAEQNRIVAKLDTLFAQLETIKASMANIPLLIKDFRQQVLTQAVTGKLTEEWRKGKELEEWKINKMGNIITSIQSGKSFLCPEVPVTKGQVGLVKISAVTWEVFDQTKTKTVTDKNKIIPEYFIKKGDFLMSRANTLELVGASVIVDKIDFDIMLSDKVWRINFDNDNDKIFINYFLKSKQGRIEIESKASGNQESMRNLSQNNFKDIEVKFPTHKEQQEIVSRVESLFAKADAIEQQYKTLKACIDNVPQAILHKAFKGELSEQLESDGDARELLQQIQQLKEATTKAGKNIKSKTQISKAKKVKNYPENEEVLRMVAEHQ